jgi:zinc transporter ZupT
MAQRDRRPDEPERDEEGEERWARRWPWLLPLAAGIFLGAAVFEMQPEALELAGQTAWLWAIVGVLVFISVRYGLDEIGQRGLAWVATLVLWLHSFLEGAVAGLGFQANLVTGLLVTGGLILHLIPELGASLALMSSAGLSQRQGVTRTLITWGILVLAFVAFVFFWPDLPQATLGAALAAGAGGFLYLAYASWQERRWEIGPSAVVAALGVLLLAAARLLVS